MSQSILLDLSKEHRIKKDHHRMSSSFLKAAFAFSVIVTSHALSTIAPPVYQLLQTTPLQRASDDASIVLTDLWRNGTPFGMADETAVCCFLRHFG